VVVVVVDEPGLFEDDELDDVGWGMDPASCCWTILFSSPCIWMRLFSRLIVSWELGLWGGEEPTVGLSAGAELGLVDCGEDAESRKGENMGASVLLFSRKSIRPTTVGG
jgi:hypothetical protein